MSQYYEVTALNRARQRLHPRDWPAPEFGWLAMEKWGWGKSGLRRQADVAVLRQRYSVNLYRTALILIEPRVTHLPLGDMVWAGTVLTTENDEVVELPQRWLLRRTTAGANPLPAFDWQHWMRENQPTKGRI